MPVIIVVSVHLVAMILKVGLVALAVVVVVVVIVVVIVVVVVAIMPVLIVIRTHLICVIVDFAGFNIVTGWIGEKMRLRDAETCYVLTNECIGNSRLISNNNAEAQTAGHRQ